MRNVITANRLEDGIVVYLGHTGDWTSDLAAARVVDSRHDLEALEKIAAAAVAACHVVGVYAMDVDLSSGKPMPKSVREKIRAAHRQTFKDLTEIEIR
ncbi:MAG: hypothetical protein APF80_11815 [Alphaproteobacteria bacterium BRH_c36]|nr:MAG: hypothetical protein APF80_11815 [Alphaproteobacteria bacterium BRH_c36]